MFDVAQYVCSAQKKSILLSPLQLAVAIATENNTCCLNLMSVYWS